jgi:hypothetical protein
MRTPGPGGWDPSVEGDRHKSANVWIWANESSTASNLAKQIARECIRNNGKRKLSHSATGSQKKCKEMQGVIQE